MEELMNPVKIIEFILNFAQGFISFMSYSVNIPGVGNAPLWTLIVTSLGALLTFIFLLRLFL